MRDAHDLVGLAPLSEVCSFRPAAEIRDVANMEGMGLPQLHPR